ncbi:MAG: extracellular solute-binding protein [Atribacterota bacterium]|nr:extracellular solute-binding protein [Atribacterota bacterium]
MRKLLLWMLVVVISISMVAAFSLTGCKEEAASTEEASAATEEASVATEEAPVTVAEPVVLTRYIIAATQTSFDIDQVERFKEKYPNIIVNDVMVAETAGLDGMVLYAAGNNPTIWKCGLPQMAAYINAEIPMVLDDYVTNWDDLQYIRTDMLDLQRVNGKLYAVPKDMYVMNLYYNKKMFAEAGLVPPTTWDEWFDVAVQLTDPEKNQWGFQILPCWEEWHFEYFVWMAGGDLTKQNPDGTLALTFDDPAVKTAIEFYQKLIAADAVQPDFTQDYNTWLQNFANGNAAMVIGGCDNSEQFIEWGMDPEDIGYAEFPVGPSGQKVGQIGGAAEFIFNNATEEVADAAWAWLSFKNSKEELEARLRDRASKGGASPQVMLRSDVDASLGEINPEWQAVVDAISEYARFEFYGKGVVGGYIANAVNKLEFEPNADIKKVFRDAAEAAKDDVNKFNEGVLESKQE